MQRDDIAAAAKRLDELREGWLNPLDARPEDLALRTLTRLYNDPPTWLRDVHRTLDQAVLAAYGWPVELADDEILAGLLELNQQRSGAPRSTARPD